MSYYPPIGSVWRYTGQNPALRTTEGYNTVRGLPEIQEDPQVEILEPPEGGSLLVRFRVLGRERSREIVYRPETFMRYFVPGVVHTEPLLVNLAAILGELKTHPKQIHELLVVLEI